MDRGMKHDRGKPRWSLFPTQVLWGVVKVLEFGATKYEVGNWMLLGDDACIRFWDALGRHSDAMERGEDTDPESSLAHAWHLSCTTLMFAWHFMNNEPARLRWQQRFQLVPPGEPDIRGPIPTEPILVHALDTQTAAGLHEPHEHIWELSHQGSLKQWTCKCGGRILECGNGRYARSVNDKDYAYHSTYYEASR